MPSMHEHTCTEICNTCCSSTATTVVWWTRLSVTHLYIASLVSLPYILLLTLFRWQKVAHSFVWGRMVAGPPVCVPCILAMAQYSSAGFPEFLCEFSSYPSSGTGYSFTDCTGVLPFLSHCGLLSCSQEHLTCPCLELDDTFHVPM
jgi:hypothetical protein